MNVRIINFRKHKDLTLELTGVNRIFGDSGIGKSTIFEAIYWCLYGRLKKVKPHGRKNAKTEVLVNVPIGEDGHITVHRSGQKAVTVLQRIPGGKEEEYGGDMAQNKVDTFFGPHNAFLLTSYLRTDTLHPLLGGSLADKREYTALIFPDASKYNIYKEKLMARRKQDQALLIKYEMDLQRAYSAVSTMEESNPWIRSFTISESADKVDEKSVENTLRELRSDRDTYLYLTKRYRDLQDQLKPYASMTGLDAESVTVKEHELEQLKARLLQSTVESKTKEGKLEYLQSRLDSIMSSIDSSLGKIGISSMDISTCERLITVCNNLLSIADSSQDLKNKIEETKDEYSKNYEILTQYEQSLLDQEYNEKLENILECPHCHGKVQYMDTLIPHIGDCIPKPIIHNVSRTEVSKLRVLVDKLDEKKTRLASQYNKYQAIIAKENLNIKDIDLKTIDIKILKSTLEEFKTLSRDYETVQKDIGIIKEDTKEYISPEEYKSMKYKVETISKDLKTTELAIEKRDSLLKDIKAIEVNHEKYISNPSYISTLEQKIQDEVDKLSQLRTERERKKLYNLYLRPKEATIDREKNKDNVANRLEMSKKLEVILASAYGEYVSMRLKEIEYDIAVLAKIFFDESMNISLSAGKEDLIGTVKPGFDISINYGGIDYGDDLSTISTGERKRLSIILLMVLSKYMDGRFILLDEGLSSVSMDMRAIIVEELQKLNIPILITSHDEIAGSICEYELK